MDKFAVIHNQQRQAELDRQQAERADAGLPPIVMPGQTDSVNLAAQIEAGKSYKSVGDQPVSIIEDGEHPFGGNANNLRVAQRVANEREQAPEPSVVLTPQQAAKDQLAKAAAYDETVDANDPATTTGKDEDETDGGSNAVLPQLTPAQKAAETRKRNAEAAAGVIPQQQQQQQQQQGVAPPLPEGTGAAPTFQG